MNSDKKDELTRDYVQYSKVASSVLIYTILVYFMIIFTAPFALYFSIKGYGKKEGFFRGVRKVQMFVNIIVSGLICLSFLVGIIYLIVHLVL